MEPAILQRNVKLARTVSLASCNVVASSFALACVSCASVQSPEGMLEVMYKRFVKSHVAGFARVMSDLARGTAPECSNGHGDAFARSIFAEAGRHLGSLARTLAPNLLADGAQQGQRCVSNFNIVCVGSVWKSWDLLQESFIAAATAPFHYLPASVVGTDGAAPSAHASVDERGCITSFRLLRLKETSAVGAAWRAAVLAGRSMDVDFSSTSEVLFEYSGR